MFSQAPWDYELEKSRRAFLLDAPPYEAIIEELCGSSLSLVLTIDVGQNSPVEQAVRPVFLLETPTSAFDLFYNGPTGYRAQYYISPELGIQANGFALQSLEQKLFDYATSQKFTCQKTGFKITQEQFIQSMRDENHKIWADEKSGDFPYKLRIAHEKLIPEIIAPRWIDRAASRKEPALIGVKAPLCSQLKIIGSFVRDGTAVMHPLKKLRAKNIHEYGFTQTRR